MQRNRPLRFFALLLCLCPGLVHAEIGEAVGFHKLEKNDYKESDWAEEPLTLPAYPKDADLIEFYVSAAATNHFFVDGATLSAGKDGIVRYTLVVKTSGGATNVSYEGIRCGANEYKLYATGRADNSWVLAKTDTWRPIENKLTNRYHAALNREFLCPIGKPIGSAEEGSNALRLGKHPLAP